MSVVLLVLLTGVGLSALLMWAEVIHHTGMSCMACLKRRDCSKCGGRGAVCEECHGVGACDTCGHEFVDL